MWDLIKTLIEKFTNKPVTPPAPVTPAFDGTELKLVRKISDTYSTEGELWVNGVWFSYTIELPKDSFEGSNVRIPVGTFFITKYASPHWGFDVPLLQDVPGRGLIEIHPSNYAINPETHKVFLLGCIALGDSEETDVVYDSKVTFEKLMAKIDWTRPVKITITEE